MDERKEFRVLFVEDEPLDAELAVRELVRGGMELRSFRVDTEKALLEALDSFAPDIVISDYMMPSFDGMRALAAVRSRSELLPFIILTGSMNEDTAVSCLKAGANDYVIKEHVARLPFAVREALGKRDILEASARKEALLRDSEARYRSLFEESDAVMIIIDPETMRLTYANPAAVAYYGWSVEELIGKSIYEINTLPESVLKGEMGRVLSLEQSRFMFKHRRADGTIRDVETHSSSIQLDGKSQLFCIIHDITARKEAQKKLEVSLREKSVLLREIHHRVKNNMQVIISLMNLSAESRAGMDCSDVIPEIARRIQSMSMIHDQFYESEDVARIDFAKYLQQLIADARVRLAVSPDYPKLECESEAVFLNLETAIPVGLLVSELLENALECALKGKADRWAIRIDQRILEGAVLEISLKITGCESRARIGFYGPSGLRLELVNILTEQLHGEIALAEADCADTTLRFPLPA